MRLSALALSILAQLERHPANVRDLAILVFPLRRGGGWTASRRQLSVANALGRMLAGGLVEHVAHPSTWQLTERGVALLASRR